jgi:hypothetical protein
MRLISSAALLVAATLIAAPAHAQLATSFSIAAGASMPVGSTGDNADVGYNAILGVGIKPPLAPVGLRVEGMFSEMGFKNTDEANFRTLAGTANVTISGAGMAVPMGYLIGGLGLYNNKCAGDGCGILSDESETDFGFNVGVGLNIPLTGFGTFVEARLHVINTEGSSTKFIPITFGMRF